MHELVEIAQQTSDSVFAQLLKRAWESQQTNNDAIQVKALANTDTDAWSHEFVKVYLNNYIVAQENKDCVGKLDSEFAFIKAQDSNKDIKTNICSITRPDNISLSQTSNLLAKLKLCVGARMLADNISVFDRLINGSIGTIKHLDMRSKSLYCTLYVKFANPKAGNSPKDRRLCDELDDCVTIIVRAKWIF